MTRSKKKKSSNTSKNLHRYSLVIFFEMIILFLDSANRLATISTSLSKDKIKDHTGVSRNFSEYSPGKL